MLVLDSNLLVTVECCCTPCAREQAVPYSRVTQLEMAQGALEVTSHPSLPSEDRGRLGLVFGEPGWALAYSFASWVFHCCVLSLLQHLGSWGTESLPPPKTRAKSGTVCSVWDHLSASQEKATVGSEQRRMLATEGQSHPVLHIAHPPKRFLVLAEFTHLLTLWVS